VQIEIATLALDTSNRIRGVWYGCSVKEEGIMANQSTTPPSGPQIINEATFGGTSDAFQARYGSPAPHGHGVMREFRFQGNGLSGFARVTPSSDQSSDGKYHIRSLVVGPLSGFWDEATAKNALALFLPIDAQYQRDETVEGLLYHLYLSPNLGATFPASEFTSQATGASVTPGTFWAYYNSDLHGAYVCQLGE
jgi:hypothetical protein